MKFVLFVAAALLLASVEAFVVEQQVSGSYVGRDAPVGDFPSDYVTAVPAGSEFKVVNHKVLKEALIGQTITGHALTIEGAGEAFHIYNPNDKCPGVKATSVTSAAHGCKIATNAGFFDMSHGSCIGEIVSDGKTIHSDPAQRSMFGITADGKYIAGYGNESFVKSNQFKQLVQGRGWLVRDGKSYVATSANKENIGSSFVKLLAPRLAIGWNSNGQLLLVVVDGVESKRKGLDLNTFASLLINLGAVEAINLDGGGSVTLVWDGHICESSGVGQEACHGNPTGPVSLYKPYERPVTSITCFK